MGGIIGKLSFDRDIQLSFATVERMLGHVASRDATFSSGHRNTYTDEGLALGCAGDTSSSAAVGQNEACTICVVANAELSNATALRALLEDHGHLIRTDTDAELVAHAYEEWGDASVARLAGPFAFALWDRVERRLLLARDPFGIRPLCFALHGDGVLFASDIKALLEDPRVGREWSPEAIDAYLGVGYVAAPLTLYRCISKLEPAHTLVVEGRRLTTRRYCDLRAAAPRCASDDDRVDRFANHLRASVNWLAADEGTCVLTSGGLASTAVATALTRDRVSVTVGVDQAPSDLERIFRMTAHVGLRSEIDVAVVDAVEVATLLASSFDEPSSDPAAVSQYAVFHAARRYTEVALTGHGAALWDGAHRAETLFDDDLRHRLYTRRFAWQIREADPLIRIDDHARTWIASSQIAVAERASAAAGLRLRYPLLDWDVARHAGHIQDVQQFVARHLPPSLIPKARHARSSPPTWLSSAVKALVPSVLFGERFDMRGIFSRPALRQMWNEHQSGRGDHTARFWSLLMLEFWFREFIDGDASAQPAEYAVLVRAA